MRRAWNLQHISFHGFTWKDPIAPIDDNFVAPRPLQSVFLKDIICEGERSCLEIINLRHTWSSLHIHNVRLSRNQSLKILPGISVGELSVVSTTDAAPGLLTTIPSPKNVQSLALTASCPQEVVEMTRLVIACTGTVSVLRLSLPTPGASASTAQVMMCAFTDICLNQCLR